MIYWPNFLIVLATAILACFFVPGAYIIWIRLVGLEPTIAKRATELSRPTRIVAGFALGAILGVALQFVPSLYAGVSLVTMLATSAFAGLLLFEFAAEREFL